jgi:NAD(P)H-dependent FMN reductase
LSCVPRTKPVMVVVELPGERAGCRLRRQLRDYLRRLETTTGSA